MKCPHCKGELRKAHPIVNYDYVCRGCYRGWKIDEEGNWLALFDASCLVYKDGKLIAHGEKALKFYQRAGISS